MAVHGLPAFAIHGSQDADSSDALLSSSAGGPSTQRQRDGDAVSRRSVGTGRGASPESSEAARMRDQSRRHSLLSEFYASSDKLVASRSSHEDVSDYEEDLGAHPYTAILDARDMTPFQKRLMLEHRLEEIRSYKQTLDAMPPSESPAHFIAACRDSTTFEKFIPDIVACENERNVDLNLQCIFGQTTFAEQLSELRNAGQTDGTLYAIISVYELRMSEQDREAAHKHFHVISTKSTFTHDGVFVEAYDPVSLEHARPTFARLRKALCEDASTRVDGVKLKMYALDVQKSMTGCDIFALSFALKTYQADKAGTTLVIKDEHMNDRPDATLVLDDNASVLAPSFYKHAQSRSNIQAILDNPAHSSLNSVAVNKKKQQTLMDRHVSHRVTQTVDDLRAWHSDIHNPEYLSGDVFQPMQRTFSNSIDKKRITLLTRLDERITSHLKTLTPE